jgi:hypothetical protein
MKILIEPPKFKSFEFEHPACGATLLIEESDILYYHYSDQRDGTSEYFYCKCMSCGATFRIEERRIPQKLSQRLKLEKRGY